jgi:hypothetical protein
MTKTLDILTQEQFDQLTAAFNNDNFKMRAAA